MKKIDAKTQSLPWWKKPVSSLKGIGPKKAIEFEGLGIVTIGDLLNHFPRQGCYLDYSHVKTIRALRRFMMRAICPRKSCMEPSRVSSRIVFT